jgi:nucleotide-binding universal stress UspA family protein
MFERILVPVDLSQKSLKSVDMAYDFATRFGAEVVLLHVIETIEQLDFAELKTFYDRIEKTARKGLSELAERFVSNKLRVDQIVIYGHRIHAIVDYAMQNRIDLTIMASHRVDPEWPGRDWSSISYAVAILSPTPVLLAK